MKQFFKRAFYSFTGLPLVHYLGRPWRGRACVLCYHRVLPDDEIETVKNPNSNLIVPTSRFAEQMSFLAENHEVVSMDELVSYLESEPYGDLKKFVVAVTFDDGYKDNLIHALPFLEQYNIPATIYITTRFPEGDTWMWWYEIWDFLKDNNSIEIKGIQKNECWETSTLKQKTRCYNKLLERILNLPFEEQVKLVEIITNTSERKQYARLCLNWEEITFLDKHPLVTIGSHTHSHPNLRQLSKQDAFSEMSSSKAILEEKLNHSVDHFAYPFGSHEHASFREFELAKDCGFRSAVTTRPRCVKNVEVSSIPRLSTNYETTIKNFRAKLSGIECLAHKIISVNNF